MNAPIYANEMQFLGWRDSSKSGPVVSFSLPDREALERFIGHEGKRFAAVLVLIGDDEQPVEAPKDKDKPKRKPIAEWLAMRCQDPEFCEWAAKRGGFMPADEDGTATWARLTCGVSSRGDIDGDAVAEAKFRELIQRPWAAFNRAAERQEA